MEVTMKDGKQTPKQTPSPIKPPMPNRQNPPMSEKRERPSYSTPVPPKKD